MNNWKHNTRIPYFRRAVVQNFPFIANDFDALTDFGLISQVVDYLNKVIEETNNTTDNMNQLINLYNQLKEYVDNYFDNLDVQQEINNKLDEMVIDGTLQEIIAEYLNSKAVFGFDNVEFLKESTNLINGSYAKTLGYYEINDDGGATYKIRKITNEDVVDNSTIIPLSDNTLIAELIITENMTPEMFGCFGDGEHDDYSKMQIALNKSNNLICKKIYLTSDTLKINNSINMLDNSFIKSSINLDDYVVIIADTTQVLNRKFNVNVDANNHTIVGIAVDVPKNSILNLNVINAGEIGIITNYNLRTGNNENIFNCSVYGNNNGTTLKGVVVNNHDSVFKNIITKNCQYGVYLDRGELIADSIHSWISSDLVETLWDNSYVIYNVGYFNSIVKWLYQDTVKYGIGGVAPYGNITYFEYLNSLEDTTDYQDYKNVYVSSGPTRLTIDTFRNNTDEKQQLLYVLASNTTRNEFGVLNKNGVDSNVSNLNPIDIFTDCDNAPQIGGFYCKYNVSNLPQSTNGYLKSEIIGSMVKQTFIPTNFNSNPRLWIRTRELSSDTWGSWILISYNE